MDQKIIRIFCHGFHDFCKEGHDNNFLKVKYAFPNVHLIAGSISVKDEQSKFKMFYTDAEREETLLHCRHVDEVLCDVPLKIDLDFVNKHNLDYVTITDTKHAKNILEFIEHTIPREKLMELDELKPKYAGPEVMAPFSDDPVAVRKREICNYDFSNRITLENAKTMSSIRPIRIYADGIYDMFHPGHARQLKQAKEAFPNVHLMAGCVNDELTHRLKGPTHVPEALRYDKIRHCRYVDEVIRDAPWIIKEEFLISNKIDFVAHDAIPYKSADYEDVYKIIKELGMFLTTQRMEGVSTTDLKLRMKRTK